jgi:hypothetical protein
MPSELSDRFKTIRSRVAVLGVTLLVVVLVVVGPWYFERRCSARGGLWVRSPGVKSGYCVARSRVLRPVHDDSRAPTGPELRSPYGAE